MQIILLEKVVNVGNLGEVVRVRDGYARNFLIPQHVVPRSLLSKSLSCVAQSSKKFRLKNWLQPRRLVSVWKASH